MKFYGHYSNFRSLRKEGEVEPGTSAAVQLHARYQVSRATVESVRHQLRPRKGGAVDAG